MFSILLLLGWYKSFKTICYKAIQFGTHGESSWFLRSISSFLYGYICLASEGSASKTGTFMEETPFSMTLLTIPGQYDTITLYNRRCIPCSEQMEFWFIIFPFFKPAAFSGKIFGWRAANFSLFIWTFIGINLFIFLLFRYLKKANLGIVFVFYFL